MIGKRLKGYTINEVISCTENGMVVATTDGHVLKFLHHKNLINSSSRSLRQVRAALAFVNCPNVLKPLKEFRAGDFDVTVTRRATCDLYTLLEKNCKIPLRLALNLMTDACAAVKTIHDNYILHGDIKLENFLVFHNTSRNIVSSDSNSHNNNQNTSRFNCHNNNFVHFENSGMEMKATNHGSELTLMLTDFENTACLLKNKEELCYNNVGTIGYASPEFLDGHSFPSDVYALGVTLGYIWKRTNKRDRRMNGTTNGICEQISALLQRMVAESPKDRPTAGSCLKSLKLYEQCLVARKKSTRAMSFNQNHEISALNGNNRNMLLDYATRAVANRISILAKIGNDSRILLI